MNDNPCDKAYDRLTAVQKHCINRDAFNTAYSLITTYEGHSLIDAIISKTKSCPHLTADLIRYCRLAQSVM